VAAARGGCAAAPDDVGAASIEMTAELDRFVSVLVHTRTP
jgi:hypothetical protein